MAWAKLKQDGLRGKRHYKYFVELDEREREAVNFVLDNPPDEYMRFVVGHDACIAQKVRAAVS